MNWVHCNSCFVQPGPQAPQFVITSCGHIFCAKCNEKASRDKCPVCQCVFTTIELNEQMKSEVKDYFGDPIELAQKAVSIAKFQASHNDRLIARLRQYHGRYSAVKSEAMELSDENSRLRKKLRSMEMAHGWYKSQITSMKRKMAQWHEAAKQRMTPAHFDGDFSPAPGVAVTPSSDFGSPRIPAMINANTYRLQPNFTPFVTPASSTGFSRRSGCNLTQGSNTSRDDLKYQNSGRRNHSRMQTPSEFSSPSVLRPISLASNGYDVEFLDVQKIGVGLAAFGVSFLFLGVLLIFDKGLLAIGNILFISGLACVIGLERTFRFFFQRHKARASVAFFGGITVVLFGFPLIGMLLETYGFILLFSGFFPVAINFLRRVPLVGFVLNLPLISGVVDRLAGDSNRTTV